MNLRLLCRERKRNPNESNRKSRSLWKPLLLVSLVLRENHARRETLIEMVSHCCAFMVEYFCVFSYSLVICSQTRKLGIEIHHCVVHTRTFSLTFFCDKFWETTVITVLCVTILSFSNECHFLVNSWQ